MVSKSPNNAINSDGRRLRCAPLFAAGYGWAMPQDNDLSYNKAKGEILMKTKVVFHIDWDNEEPLIMALNNMENLLKEVPAEEAVIYLVANGVAVKLFQLERAAQYISRIEKLFDIGVRFLVCNNSLRNLGIECDELMESCRIVPAGILELIRLQDEQCAYIKP